jgi:hypothetical protein
MSVTSIFRSRESRASTHGSHPVSVPLLCACMSLFACHRSSQERATMPTTTSQRVAAAGSFADDLAFLTQHTRITLLKSQDGRAQVAVAPEYQGRVMTSSAEGDSGQSFGYIHRAGIAVGKPTPHISVVGGEDRFWLGPEGGNFALYFAPGAPFDFAHWQVPEALDWGAWQVKSETASEVRFERALSLTNYHGTPLSLRVDRAVRLLQGAVIEQSLGCSVPPGVSGVAYESENHVTNTGENAWQRATGLVSIWILGMFRPAPRATVVIPFQRQAEGPIVRSDYFGNIGPERLRVADAHIFFRADGKQRGKLGVPFVRAQKIAGSYDPDSRALTLVQYSRPDSMVDYVSSTWELQDDPYAGDVVNSYNDGPTPEGPPLGPFYEIESSSPALALASGASATHVHRTFHFTGEIAALDALARAALGVGLQEIESALP